jgi:hypothetical protein
MDTPYTLERTHDLSAARNFEHLASSKKKTNEEVVIITTKTLADEHTDGERSSVVPLKMEIIANLLITATGFRSHWSSPVTRAMKSTLKKVSVLHETTRID